MHSGRFVFSQVMQHLPSKAFRRCVRRYRRDRHIQSFTCLDRFLCLAFAQLTHGESLRDIYKAAHVEAVPPMYTSQTCGRCGTADPESRRSQSEFECVHCGHTGNADVNAALNIMASATGAAGRRGALALATPTNRQHVCKRRAA